MNEEVPHVKAIKRQKYNSYNDKIAPDVENVVVRDFPRRVLWDIPFYILFL